MRYSWGQNYEPSCKKNSFSKQKVIDNLKSINQQSIKHKFNKMNKNLGNVIKIKYQNLKKKLYITYTV